MATNKVWQADFLFVYVDGYGFYQLLTFLDAFSRLPVYHELQAQAGSEVAAEALREIGEIKPIDRHEGRQKEIIARREELFSSIKRNGR